MKYSEISDEDDPWVCGAEDAQAAKDYVAARRAEAKTCQPEPEFPVNHQLAYARGGA